MIKKIIYTVLVFFSLGIILNYGYSKIFKNYEINSINEIKNEYKNNGTYDYIIVGDSHPKAAINPSFFNNTKIYNYSFKGKNLKTIYYNLDILINKENIKTNSVILGLDPNMFSEKRYGVDSESLSNLKFYSKYYTFNEISNINNNSKIDTIKESYKEKFVPYLGKYVDILLELRKIIISKKDTYKGWEGEDNKLNKEPAIIKINNTYNTIFSQSEESFIYLEKMLNILKNNNINIIIIKYPLTKEYYDLLPKKYIDNYTNTFNKIIIKNNIDIKIYDYTEKYFENSDYFVDPDHLNKKGATFFSKELYNKIILGK